ncbi:uncharacterized protein (DUF1501 family) [Marmoricola sp. OAE513]|uniref:DUF1501 domain-containing protein n=1 Tax=Marmoricola sp. OAE513 TaxID=2817894 RepID=UPI001AE0FA9A
MTTIDCCTELSGMSRRGLLKGGITAAGVGMATSLFGGTFLQASYGATRKAGNVLVLLSLRGAADGLSLVVPHADPAYYAARPRIAIPKASLLARNDTFGLHPKLAPLLPMWQAGKIAAVHATGLPAPNRSHFSAMEELEDADPGSAARVGWINRLIGQDDYRHPLQAIGMGMSVPITALYGPQPTVTAASVDAISLAGDDQWDTADRRRRSMQTMWAGAGGAMGSGARSALSTIADFQPVAKSSKTPANGADYPSDDLGQALRAAARIIRSNVGTDVIAVDHDGGWDMHTDLGTLDWGRMVDASSQLASGLAAFFQDLGSLGDKVTVVTISEFGRRVKENANYGLDHGHGNVMFLLGAGVKGGYYGSMPSLTNSLDADLPVTTDYRSVLSEVVTKRLGASTAAVFPGFAPESVGAINV